MSEGTAGLDQGEERVCKEVSRLGAGKAPLSTLEPELESPIKHKVSGTKKQVDWACQKRDPGKSK